MTSGETFGEAIARQRKALTLGQKELAARIAKEDGTPISPQYLNDLERDRRNPPPQPLLQQFARELNLPFDYLAFLAGELPEDIRRNSYGPEKVTSAFQLFRKALRDE